MNADYTKDKPIFVATLLASFLAFIALKDNLSLISISLGFCQTTFLQLFVVFIVLLAVSAYLYALDYIRYGYGPRMQDSIIFKWIIPVANFLYILAMVFPFIVFLAWIINILIKLIKIPSLEILLIITNSLLTVLTLILAFTQSKIFTKNLRKEYAEKFKKEGEQQLQRTGRLYRNKSYSESVFEAFKVFESFLREKLEKKGIYTKNFKVSDLINSALKENILSPKDISKIDELRNTRNKVSHFKTSFTKQDADFALKAVEEIIQKAPTEDKGVALITYKIASVLPSTISFDFLKDWKVWFLLENHEQKKYKAYIKIKFISDGYEEEVKEGYYGGTKAWNLNALSVVMAPGLDIPKTIKQKAEERKKIEIRIFCEVKDENDKLIEKKLPVGYVYDYENNGWYYEP